MKPQKTHSAFTVLDGIFLMLSKYMYLLFVYNILNIYYLRTSYKICKWMKVPMNFKYI